jgi:hypothetical protein
VSVVAADASQLNTIKDLVVPILGACLGAGAAIYAVWRANVAQDRRDYNKVLSTIRSICGPLSAWYEQKGEGNSEAAAFAIGTKTGGQMYLELLQQSALLDPKKDPELANALLNLHTRMSDPALTIAALDNIGELARRRLQPNYVIGMDSDDPINPAKFYTKKEFAKVASPALAPPDPAQPEG